MLELKDTADVNRPELDRSEENKDYLPVTQ